MGGGGVGSPRAHDQKEALTTFCLFVCLFVCLFSTQLIFSGDVMGVV